MGFLKKGYRANKRKVTEGIKLSFAAKMAKVPVLTYIANELHKKVETLTVGNFLEHYEQLGLTEDLDELDIKLIIGEYLRLKQDEQGHNNS